tara:strand:- start:138 stop:509 length:372 start_codon:yes stop_codon:yes gene_type:complete
MKKHHKTREKEAQILPLKQLSHKVHQLAYQDSPLITEYEQNKPRKVQDNSANALTEENIKSIRIKKGIAERINSWLRQEGVKNKKLSQTHVRERYRGLIKYLGGIGINPSPFCGFHFSNLNSK